MSYTSFARNAALSIAVAAAATTASADGHALNLEGETVEFIIPFSETGGSARWANFYAPLLSEALPGNPTVVVTFMPGAGSTTGANHFQGLTYENGTTIFGSSGSTQFPYLLDDPRVRYEAESKDGHSDPVVPSGRAIAQRIKGTPGITG